MLGNDFSDVDHNDPVERVRKISPTQGEAPGIEETGSFEESMKRLSSQPTPSQRVSPFDLVSQKSQLATGPTYDGVLAQINSTEKTSKTLQDQLNTPGLKLKQSQKFLLENKLADANEHIRAAGHLVKAEMPTAAELLAAPTNPVTKFLALITDGERKMASVKDQIANLRAKNDELNPADFLILQMKMSRAQAELEYSSMLLSKVVEDLKTVMNINL